MHLGGKITTRSFSFFYNSMGCDRKKVLGDRYKNKSEWM